jgi:hypothetical protein
MMKRYAKPQALEDIAFWAEPFLAEGDGGLKRGGVDR